DRINLNSQIEHLQSKHVGTGHADTSKYEWLTNQHRDTYASFIGHPNWTTYIAVAENESVARVPLQANMLDYRQKMLQPCGPPVPRND
ncbi:splicing factor 3B subunit 5/RDS3 complex subunit 10, partial [Thamnocephalis sphaerospora]